MIVSLTDQSHRFPALLDKLCQTDVMRFDRSSLVRKTTSIDIPIQRHPTASDLKFIFSYKIFPAQIMSFKGEWSTAGRTMRPGDTILQQVNFPPFTASVKMIFGVRVTHIADTPFEKGFTYVTLDGHVERGESAFTLTQINSSQMKFTITTFSEAGSTLTRIAGPFLTTPYQAYCTRKALENVRDTLLRRSHDS